MHGHSSSVDRRKTRFMLKCADWSIGNFLNVLAVDLRVLPFRLRLRTHIHRYIYIDDSSRPNAREFIPQLSCPLFHAWRTMTMLRTSQSKTSLGIVQIFKFISIRARRSIFVCSLTSSFECRRADTHPFDSNHTNSTARYRTLIIPGWVGLAWKILLTTFVTPPPRLT